MSNLIDEVKIRQVAEHDLEACYAVETRCFFPSEAASKAKIEKRIKIFPQGFLVAKLDGAVIGHVNSGATHQEDITDEAFKDLVGHDSEGNNIVSFSLAVWPEFQKKGLAQQLMLEFIEQSKRLGKIKIMLICKSDLIAYYQKYGFVYVGKSASTHGGFKWHDMYLPLEA